jgi:hypothetical protein
VAIGRIGDHITLASANLPLAPDNLPLAPDNLPLALASGENSKMNSALAEPIQEIHFLFWLKPALFF